MEPPEVSDDYQPSKPVAQHEWLKNLLGEWKSTCTMSMGPDGPEATSHGTESVVSLGGLFAHVRGKAEMPGGDPMNYHVAIGYDLTFEEYRGVWYADVSSHLWNYVGTLSEDGKSLALECEGPNMNPGSSAKTARYRDTHIILGPDHRRMTSEGQGEDGEWTLFMTTDYVRA